MKQWPDIEDVGATQPLPGTLLHQEENSEDHSPGLPNDDMNQWTDTEDVGALVRDVLTNHHSPVIRSQDHTLCPARQPISAE